jgi:hypothetical protein
MVVFRVIVKQKEKVMTTDEKVIEYLLRENKRLQEILDHTVFNELREKPYIDKLKCTYVFPSLACAKEFTVHNAEYFNSCVLDKNKEYCVTLEEYTV